MLNCSYLNASRISGTENDAIPGKRNPEMSDKIRSYTELRELIRVSLRVRPRMGRTQRRLGPSVIPTRLGSLSYSISVVRRKAPPPHLVYEGSMYDRRPPFGPPLHRAG